MLFLAIVSSLFLLAQASVELCVADCSGAREGGKVKDPVNCLRYYYCSDPDGSGTLVPSLVPSTCPTGYFFNAAASVMECEKIVPNTDYCKNLCNPCHLQCVDPGSLLPYPLNCNLYKICLDDGSSLDVACPVEHPYFDFQTGMCTDDASLCYNACDPCETYCVAEGKTPDPNNCWGYFYCDPPETAPFLCPEGEAFDPDDLICAPATNCTNLCLTF
ncbi:peritrophin-48-like isoform X2 [Procambarus clarkii]|uniref:peritrophin-48-like isoform X2 n=1 Tax=Procambarus clarkii TaxID=6728 RepID=UPI001E677F51|nr:uncharacterized protein LOC123759368 isoform X2 [Procambarus clarkii]